jgi:6-phosphofructokinase 2
VIRLPGLTATFRSAVGAGDSFLAALTLSLARGDSSEEALAWGIAAGIAAVECAGTTRVTRAGVEAQYQRMG